MRCATTLDTLTYMPCTHCIACIILFNFLIHSVAIQNYVNYYYAWSDFSRQFECILQCTYLSSIKGQLISKCPYEMIVSSKISMKLFLDFCPEIFCTFLGASWLFGASCRLPCLWYYILIPQETQKTSRKPPVSYKKFRAEIQK